MRGEVRGARRASDGDFQAIEGASLFIMRTEQSSQVLSRRVP